MTPPIVQSKLEPSSTVCVPAFFLSFIAASAEDLATWNRCTTYKIARWGGGGFITVASLVGQLVKYGMLDDELVRRHLVKSLISHHYADNDNGEFKSFRAGAIYQILVAAGGALLQGLIEPEDVQVCFKILDSEIPLGRVGGLDAGKLQVGCAARSGASNRNLTCLVRNFETSITHG